jgi:putative transposase
MRIEQTKKRYAQSGHILYSCEYHIVWCTKYRRGVLTEPIQDRLKSLIYEKQKDYKYEAIEIEVMPDHVHLLANIDPNESPGNVVSRIKGWTSNQLRSEFPELKTRLPNLWTRSKFISTTGGVTLESLKQYVESQKGV